jgi:large subunit ribosomal protein L11
MAPKKKVTALIKLQIQAGAATPAPPVGPALGQHGVNIMDFVKAYNAATESQKGNIIPVEILKAAGIEKGSSIPHKDKVANLTKAQVEDIAKQKMVDLNANDLEMASRIIAGTARSMGITVSN